ncbi:MAG: sugar phosphate isomerase/epimerase family protein [Thermomicrobiales bacterium]
MKLALRELMAPGDSLADRLTWIDQAGLQGVELFSSVLDMPHDEIRRSFADSPVRLASIDSGQGLVDPDPAVRAAAKDRIRARLELAGSLGATGVLVVPQFARNPGLPDLSPVATPRDLERGLVVAALRELAPVAAANGTALFIEPLNRYEAWMVNRIEQGVALGDEAAPGIGVMADFFHMSIEESDLAAAILAHADRIVHIHLADSNRLQPGRGHLDFAAPLAALKQSGYDAWFGIECRLDGPPDQVIPEAAAHVRAMWDGVPSRLSGHGAIG